MPCLLYTALLGYVPLPADAIGLIAGVNMAVGLFAFAGATAGDFARFARTRKDAVLSCIVGVIPAALVALLAGAALAIVTGQGDIAVIMNSIGPVSYTHLREAGRRLALPGMRKSVSATLQRAGARP